MEAEARREQILEAAAGVFASRGYHRTRVSDIIEVAGVARGTFYLYFESKRGLFEALVERMFDKLQAVIQPIDVHSEVSPAVQLRENLRRVFDVLREERELNRILFHEAVGIDSELDERLALFYEAVVVFLDESLETGQQIGFLRPLDRPIVARAILGIVKETVRDPGLGAPELDTGALVDTLLDFALRGLVAEG